MNRTMAMIATTTALVGCAAGIRTVEPAVAASTTVDTTAAPPPTTDPSDVTDATDVPFARATSDPACLIGTWEIDAVGDADSLQGAGDLDGVTLTLDSEGEWTLAVAGGTFTGIVDGTVVQTVLTGAASGTYTTEGDTVSLTIDAADGTAESALQPVEFADVIAATLPPGRFHVVCDRAAGAQLLSDTNSAIALVDHHPLDEPPAPASTDVLADDCLVGEWTLDGVGTAVGTGTITGVTVTFDGAAWSFTAEDAVVSGVLAGAPITGTFDGTASGTYVRDGDVVEITTDLADGTVSPAFGDGVTFVQLLTTLVPSSTIDVVCDGQSATLTSGPSVLTLTRLARDG